MRARHVFAVACVLIISACAGPAPGPSGSANPSSTSSPSTSTSSSPTPEAPGPVTAFVIGGDEVTAVDAEGDLVSSHAYDTDTDAMLAYLQPLLGAPHSDSNDFCVFYDWGPDTLSLIGVYGSGYHMLVKVPQVNGIRLESTEGFAVGDEVGSYLSSHPANEFGAVRYDPQGSSSTLGAWAYTFENAVYSMASPTSGGLGDNFSCGA
jgi:hypothetical protein